MALTNFAALTNEQKTVWSMDFWKHARNYSFMNKFVGSSSDSLIQRVTELRKDERGARAVITLIADLLGDGIAGDRTLEGNEESMRSYDQVIRIDQLRHANRNMGRMAEQKSIVRFREQSRDKLAYWMADRMDQMAFLTLSGVGYDKHTNGATRVGSDLINLEYAADVTAPSAARHLVWDATGGFGTNTDESTLAVADTPSWEMFVELKAYAKNNYVRPIRTKDGIDFYHAFLTPDAMAKLKQDSSYLSAVKDAGVRGASNQLFKGTDTVMVDGIAISEYRHVYNTRGLASGSKWGSGGAGKVDGCRMLFCGAQAMAFADIGSAMWDEEMFDYENQIGISTGKIFGFLKPKFHTDVTNSVEDFGVIAVDVATGGADS
jgi:N4-gp56 family major capsid protein